MSIFKKQISLGYILIGCLILSLPIILTACPGDQTGASQQNASTASEMWGNTPNIKNYYEYAQLKAIYELRDNPKLILNAYLFSDVTGQLTCLGKVKGFGVPYGTQWSQPNTASGGSVPEPNALYPSTNTSADWVQLIDPVTGAVSISFIEPNMIITSQSLPCTPLKGTTAP